MRGVIGIRVYPDPITKDVQTAMGLPSASAVKDFVQSRYGYDAGYLKGRMVGALGGMAAEQVVFGDLTTGCP